MDQFFSGGGHRPQGDDRRFLSATSFGVHDALGNAFAVFGEDVFGVFVEGLFAAGAADVVGRTF
jgi:hypothetical protein